MPRPLLPANDVINLIMKNQTILITGGTTGIGLATAKLLSAEGAKIIVTGRNPETLAAVQRELPGVIVIKSDSGSLSAAQSLGGEVKKHVDHLDGVFLNAGIATITPFESESPQNFDNGFNVRGPFFQLQSLLPFLGNPSAVVFNSSLGASIAIPAESVYCATKAAVSSLGKTLAVELAPRASGSILLVPVWSKHPFSTNLACPESSKRPIGRCLRPNRF
jgi:NAD(P)-dependent dehydrogenase (short-subunit alcohol dehydrogenase family)